MEPALLDASSAFVGGTAYAGLTCSALTAGVMLLGLEYGEGELGARRVLRAIAGMATGGHAFADDVAALNGPMQKGHDLVVWFRTQFGTTRCRDLTRADFGTLRGVEEYVASGTVSRCREIARAVAARVRDMIERPRSGS